MSVSNIIDDGAPKPWATLRFESAVVDGSVSADSIAVASGLEADSLTIAGAVSAGSVSSTGTITAQDVDVLDSTTIEGNLEMGSGTSVINFPTANDNIDRITGVKTKEFVFTPVADTYTRGNLVMKVSRIGGLIMCCVSGGAPVALGNLGPDSTDLAWENASFAASDLKPSDAQFVGISLCSCSTGTTPSAPLRMEMDVTGNITIKNLDGSGAIFSKGEADFELDNFVNLVWSNNSVIV